MKRISEILSEAQGARPLFSFEFFPPKNPAGEEQLFRTVETLRDLKPDYISVTYGAGGATRDRTVEWVRRIQDDFGLVAMAHYTSIGARPAEVLAILDDLASAGIRNIMALRGDMPKDDPNYAPPADGFRYGSELISFIRRNRPEFCLGGGCYPEVHPEAASAEADLASLKVKEEAGVDFLVTQLFFDNQKFFDFERRARALGVTRPIVPGIMPIANYKQITRITAMSGCTIPVELSQALEACGDDQARVLAVSRDYSVRQCRELLARGVPGIHFYTLNQSQLTQEILREIRRS